MIVLNWAVLCQRVIEDKHTNQISYIDIIRAGFTEKLPSRLPPFVLAMRFIRIGDTENDKFEITIKSISPSNKVMDTYNINNIEISSTDQHVAIDVPGIQVEEFGWHSIAIYRKDTHGEEKQLASLLLQVREFTPPTDQTKDS